jgi:hypothetical protein
MQEPVTNKIVRMQHVILKNAALSVIVCAALTGLVVLSLLLNGGIALTQFMVIYGIHILLLWAGVGCLIVRILRLFLSVKWFSEFAWKFTNPGKFGYVFLVVGNIWIGILAIILYVMWRANLSMVKMMLPNLIIGLILLANCIFYLRIKKKAGIL